MVPESLYSNSFARFLNLIFIFSFSIFPSNINGEIFMQADEENGIQIDQFDFLNASSGWVLLDEQLFWTSDAGQTWEEIGPSIPPGATIQDIEFVDDNTGWMLWTTINADGGSNFTIAQTANQGVEWSTTSPSLFELGETSAYSENASLGWLDEQTGWIVVKRSSSSNFSLGTLFTTSDGGNSWIRSTLPVADRVTFSDPQIGWATGGPTGDQIFKTQNGGVTWQSIEPDLPSNSVVTAYNPLYVDGQGILVMTSLGTKDSLNLHVFNGSSNDWLLTDQVTLNSQPGIIGLSIIDTKNFVVVIPGTNLIVRMRNGVSEILENHDGLSSSITDLDMISRDVGWAKSVEAKCATASSRDSGFDSVSCTSLSRILKTDNGGLTWQAIQPPPIKADASSQSVIKANSSLSVTTIANLGNTETFIGQGFDKCEIPTLSQLQKWWDSSPYKTVNLYIGGSSRACANSALTDNYLNQLHQQGWKFIPTWVGPQAPCTAFLSLMSNDPATAYDQGVQRSQSCCGAAF